MGTPLFMDCKYLPRSQINIQQKQCTTVDFLNATWIFAQNQSGIFVNIHHMQEIQWYEVKYMYIVCI